MTILALIWRTMILYLLGIAAKLLTILCTAPSSPIAEGDIEKALRVLKPGDDCHRRRRRRR
jgi:hypothetical protein